MKPPRPCPQAPRGGYILFELIIALSMFAIGVLGLARTLNTSMEVANILNREQRVRIGLRSFVEEIRRKPLAEMSASVTDAKPQYAVARDGRFLVNMAVEETTPPITVILNWNAAREN